MAGIQSSKGTNLTEGPIFRTLVVFAMPTLFSNILQSLNGSINTIWVGRFLGENALAATANANIIMFLLFSLVFGFGMAATVMVGQSFGRRDVKNARRAFGAALGLCLSLSIIVSLGGALLCDQILRALNTPPEAFADADAYLRVIFIGMPPTLLMVMTTMGLRGAGDSLTPLWFGCVGAALDAVLNPFFIIGIWPFPELGIAGSAYATAFSSYVTFLTLILYIYCRDLPIRLRGNELWFLLPRFPLALKVLGKGLPMSLQMVVTATASLVMVSLVNNEGVNMTAAYNVSQQLWTYLQLPAMAVGAAVSAMVSQNIGAGKWQRVATTTTAGLIITEILLIVLLALLFSFDRAVMTLFLGQGSPAINDGRHIQLLASWNFLFFGGTIILFATLRANGAVVLPLLLLFIALYPVRLGFYHFAYPFIGADAIWLSFPVGAFTSVVLAALYYRSGYWRR